jgi:hypothetical protein
MYCIYICYIEVSTPLHLLYILHVYMLYKITVKRTFQNCNRNVTLGRHSPSQYPTIFAMQNHHKEDFSRISCLAHMHACLTRGHYTIRGKLAAAVTPAPGDRIAADLAGGNVYIALVQISDVSALVYLLYGHSREDFVVWRICAWRITVMAAPPMLLMTEFCGLSSVRAV